MGVMLDIEIRNWLDGLVLKAQDELRERMEGRGNNMFFGRFRELCFEVLEDTWVEHRSAFRSRFVQFVDTPHLRELDSRAYYTNMFGQALIANMDKLGIASPKGHNGKPPPRVRGQKKPRTPSGKVEQYRRPTRGRTVKDRKRRIPLGTDATDLTAPMGWRHEGVDLAEVGERRFNVCR